MGVLTLAALRAELVDLWDWGRARSGCNFCVAGAGASLMVVLLTAAAAGKQSDLPPKEALH